MSASQSKADLAQRSGLSDFVSAECSPCPLLAGKLPDPVSIVSAIREQHRLWKQGAEENRTQAICCAPSPGVMASGEDQRRLPKVAIMKAAVTATTRTTP